jgi:hypothetical protein
MAKQFITSLSAETKRLTERIASNQLKPQEMGEKIITLFKDAQSELLTLRTRLTALVEPKVNVV